MLIFWIGTFITFFLDRITKFLVLKWEGNFYSLTSFLNVVKVWNKGIVFGFFSEAGIILQLLLIVMGLGVLIMAYFWAKKSDKFTKGALGILSGGGLGNLTDRILYFAVLDFIDLHLMGYHWPAFNLADVGITLSIVILLIRLFNKN